MAILATAWLLVSCVIVLVFVRFACCNFYFYIVFFFQIAIVLVFVLTERSAIVLVFVFVTKIALYAVLQLSLTMQHSLYLMTDPAWSRRLRPTNQRLPPV